MITTSRTGKVRHQTKVADKILESPNGNKTQITKIVVGTRITEGVVVIIITMVGVDMTIKTEVEVVITTTEADKTIG